jgi:hypothetical protein
MNEWVRTSKDYQQISSLGEKRMLKGLKPRPQGNVFCNLHQGFKLLPSNHVLYEMLLYNPIFLVCMYV